MPEPVVRPSVGLLASILEGLPTPVFVKDRAHRWVLLNDAACAFIGHSREELIGRSDHDFFPQEEADEFWRKDDEVFATGRVNENEERFTDAAGKTHVIITRKSLHVDADGSRFLLGVITDITPLHDAADALRRSRDELEARVRARTAELEETNRQLQEHDANRTSFLNVLSHELRNPLAAIRASASVLERAPPGTPAALRARDVLERQARQLTRLVEDLLDVTRIVKGKIGLRRTRVDARDAVRIVCDDHRPLFDERGVALRCEAPGGPVWIDVDPTRLSQVLTNLVQNALKFTPPGGTVTVETAAAGQRAEIRVRDTGVGLDPRDEDRIFEPFVQGLGEARAQRGLGLGLALVKGLVEAHGGTVRARSAGPGKGTELGVCLPLAGPPAAAGVDPAPPASPALRVLIVEDAPDVGQTLADALELEGHRVRVVRDGEEALRVARETSPEIIVCDIGLPGMDGYDVARSVRLDPSLRDVRLVALTGRAQPEERERALAAGFDAHLAKPASIEALSAAIAGGNARPPGSR
jgi:two-component system CheB/CheR fusion protein